MEQAGTHIDPNSDALAEEKKTKIQLMRKQMLKLLANIFKKSAKETHNKYEGDNLLVLNTEKEIKNNDEDNLNTPSQLLAA